MSVAVIDQAGCLTDRDRLRKVILDIEQDLLGGVLVGRGRDALLLTSMGIDGKEKTEQIAADQQRVSVRALSADCICGVKGG